MKNFTQCTRLLIVLVALALFLVSTTMCVVIRHDRDDAKYLALAARFPAVCRVGGPAPHPEGTGTLIAPQWILTAGHVRDGISVQSPLPMIKFVGKEYEIEKIVIHPCWTSAHPAHDMALIKLTRPVEGIEPIPIYRGTDELGRIVTIVGSGFSGTGLTGPNPIDMWDNKKRAATNKIDAVEKYWLVSTFDAPPSATELEGFCGPGDSGGPLIIEAEGTYYLAGIASGRGDTNKDGITGSYGDQARDARVSAEAYWIVATMEGREVATECYDEFAAVKAIGVGLLAAAVIGLLAWRFVFAK